jgi:hypothetical protein
MDAAEAKILLRPKKQEVRNETAAAIVIAGDSLMTELEMRCLPL